ncbi:MAG TPA: glycine zipper 2TM domain-containing protein [Burkholderiales bacterium]|jgi:osmotically inducible lipoprotein OsmB|nr:glycine zipper 2TM domain-containing protein [Burkholderiales bacterium]
MKARIGISLAAALAMAMLGGCGHMSKQEQHTATGAALGGVAGSAVTNGSRAGAAGGAVVGGIVGHEWDNNRK